MGSPYAKDYGGDGNGRRYSCKGGFKARCVSCGHYQAVSRLAFFRRTRPNCGACGGLLEPSENAQKKDSSLLTVDRSAPKPEEQGKCGVCHCTLSQSNSDIVCRGSKCRAIRHAIAMTRIGTELKYINMASFDDERKTFSGTVRFSHRRSEEYKDYALDYPCGLNLEK